MNPIPMSINPFYLTVFLHGSIRRNLFLYTDRDTTPLKHAARRIPSNDGQILGNDELHIIYIEQLVAGHPHKHSTQLILKYVMFMYDI